MKRIGVMIGLLYLLLLAGMTGKAEAADVRDNQVREVARANSSDYHRTGQAGASPDAPAQAGLLDLSIASPILIADVKAPEKEVKPAKESSAPSTDSGPQNTPQGNPLTQPEPLQPQPVVNGIEPPPQLLKVETPAETAETSEPQTVVYYVYPEDYYDQFSSVPAETNQLAYQPPPVAGSFDQVAGEWESQVEASVEYPYEPLAKPLTQVKTQEQGLWYPALLPVLPVALWYLRKLRRLAQFLERE
ncbi:MAG: hypothetical protein UV73_C0008G0043 [Candidatus Gottesmanbacteria bacterium GW2011_GWA2_43_14]|uniref:Uncharacterized protein n=1 Tax=Candidatus Gottesmanbacteria bacterium GW2011_GWA2_43_14 TaxID=1618443 RepID=A0A0G1GF81_9BACT|nr:MAG: hypothetical protein UV73_C0008G0043 [Candidatus Gottesmanbacteria bacterium GW2011_GWA2_43_14]